MPRDKEGHRFQGGMIGRPALLLSSVQDKRTESRRQWPCPQLPSFPAQISLTVAAR